MADKSLDIPVALFAYARPDHLRRTLACLRENRIPLLYAFSDGARTSGDERAVDTVRTILREIDWCDLELFESPTNQGLGRSILGGVGAVLERHGEAIVFEDDLVCVKGTYEYLASAMRHYRDDASVQSVTGWTHPRITPGDVGDRPYFDGRAECWVWGTWARAWQGMEQDAMSIVRKCQERGVEVNRYGADLLPMAEAELERNIWAVRFLYLHMLRDGLCLRPPWSMVEHIGFDDRATNFSDGTLWANPPLRARPAIPERWPAAVLHPEAEALQRRAFPRRSGAAAMARRMVGWLRGAR